ncbi:toxin-antitoxin system YwqK family antitoxin [Runella sp.]|uniref:toxin-antitoxin system YwqK family antitoxin n=1 Tax=Runella sp. TaxID=1960881 RepID=UPI003D0AA39D
MAALKVFSIKKLLNVIIGLGLIGASCKNTSQEVYLSADSFKIRTAGGVTTAAGKPVSGRLFSIYPSGDTAFSVGFLSGKEEGKANFWYENGQLKEQRLFKNGHKEGIHKGWWPNGKRKFLFHFQDDMYEGNVQEWDESGQPYRDMNYHLGQEEGQQRMWYDNGQLRSNYIIKNNRRYGLLGTKNCVNVADSIPDLRTKRVVGGL